MKQKEDKIFLKTLLKKGLIYLENRKSKLAITEFEKILFYRPNHSQVLNLCGVAYHQLGQFEKAIFLIERAIKYDSNEIGFILIWVIFIKIKRIILPLSKLI